jgi:hypothetical protein
MLPMAHSQLLRRGDMSKAGCKPEVIGSRPE